MDPVLLAGLKKFIVLPTRVHLHLSDQVNNKYKVKKLVSVNVALLIKSEGSHSTWQTAGGIFADRSSRSSLVTV